MKKQIRNNKRVHWSRGGVFWQWFLLVVLLCLCGGPADAEEPSTDGPVFVLDEIVVTADRQEEEIRRIPANVTVITSEDIEQTSADSITGILSAEGGLVTRDFFGNDKKANVDIRGMGETSVSNVLVLIDGKKINPEDMAGADFSSLSLDQVERIEIIRGPGSVQYGDGAVGGVINIITKPATGKRQVRTSAEAGSYQYHKVSVFARGALDKLHAAFSGNYSDTDGYRAKGYLWAKNATTDLFYDISERLAFSGRIRLHKDHYGIPGPLTIAQFNEDPRQSTDTTDSYGETWEESYSGDVEASLGSAGALTTHYTYREREHVWVQTLTPGEIYERSHDVNVSYQWDRPFGTHENSLTLGVDYRNTDYNQMASSAYKPYEIYHVGYYFLDKIVFDDQWILEGGVRYHNYDNQITTTGAETHWSNESYSVGVVRLFELGHGIRGSLFAKHATSFRIPNVDELGYSAPDIRPQEGRHWDGGVKLKPHEKVQIDVAAFYMRNENEIWYDATTMVNDNYDLPTKRKGIETSFRFYPVDALRLWGNYTYTDAYFEGASYKIPTVPENRFSAGLNWQVFDWLDLGITYHYVGSRPQGGNPIEDYRTSGGPSGSSRFEPMPSYDVIDMKVTYRLDAYNLKAFAAIKNVLDEQYYTNNYYDNVYPAPGRNFRFGVEWAF